MKVNIYDNESGEQLLKGDLSLYQIKDLLKTSLLKIQLSDYEPINSVMDDYKDKLVGWTYDDKMDLWFKVSFLSKVSTFTAITNDNVPFPAQLIYEHEKTYWEAHASQEIA